MNSIGFYSACQAVFLAAVAVLLHQRRRELRKFFHGNGWQGLGLLALVFKRQIIWYNSP